MADLPEPPSSDDPANFEDEADAFLGALPQFEMDMEAASAAAVAAAASATSSAATASTAAGNAASYAAAAQASAATLTSTSTTSNAIPTTAGVNKTFTVQSSEAWAKGMPIKAAYDSAQAASYFTGTVDSYSGTTLVITSDGGHGVTTGTFAAWTITYNAAGLPAATKEDVWAKSTNKIVPPDVLLDAMAPQTITYAGSMTWPVATKGFNVKITLTGDGSIGPPDTLYDGVIYTLNLKQDGTGGRVPVLDSIFDLGSQSLSESNTAAGKLNILSGPYDAAEGKILMSLRPAG